MLPTRLPDAPELAYRAGELDRLIGPGALFSANMLPIGWMYFNMSFCEDPEIFRFLFKVRFQPMLAREIDSAPRALVIHSAGGRSY